MSSTLLSSGIPVHFIWREGGREGRREEGGRERWREGGREREIEGGRCGGEVECSFIYIPWKID